MTRRERKPNTVTKMKGGKAYHYYRTVTMIDGRRSEKHVRIDAEPGTPEYDRIYWAIRSGKHKPAPARTTWVALIDNYRRSRRYTKLKEGTRRKYLPILDEIRAKNGARDVTKTRRADVEAIHERYADTPRKADWYVQILSILFNHAIRLEWMTHNPASTVDLFGPQREYEPWPEWFQAAYEARATGLALAAYEIERGTGQRPGDVPRMKWEDFDGEYMKVRQEKTGEPLEVYCPARLRAFLERWPRSGRYILAKNLTRRMTYDATEKAFRGVRDEIAAERAEAKRYTLHGLRYVAAVELAEAGCSDAEIAAVTGHRTLEMVQKYRGRADRKRLSRRAQTRRERKGGEG